MKHILYIHTHDTGRYIQPYGYNVSSPDLMKLAEEGTLFRNAFSTAPTCSPSRTGLLTGQSPHSAGMLGLAHRGFSRLNYSHHLVQYLKEHGFKTILCGMQHEAPEAEMIGYDQILAGDDDRDDLANAGKLAEYLNSAQGEKRLFISYGMEYTHRPFPDIRNFPDSDDFPDEDYVIPPPSIVDNQQTREDMAGFLAAVKLADRCAGIVLKALEDSGIGEETLTIFTTDHGPPFPGMKCTLYDPGIGVSLIIRYPGNKLKGGVVDSLVSQLDIFPTICDLFGLKKPEWLEGFSLLPLFQRQKVEIRNFLFGEINYHAAYEPVRCIRSERYKYIRYYGDYHRVIPANIDDSLTKDFLLTRGYLTKTREEEMLFDLYFDPLERVNLVSDKAYSEVFHKMSERLTRWMEETADPLLKGRVAKPQDAVVNRISSLSAESGEFE